MGPAHPQARREHSPCGPSCPEQLPGSGPHLPDHVCYVSSSPDSVVQFAQSPGRPLRGVGATILPPARRGGPSCPPSAHSGPEMDLSVCPGVLRSLSPPSSLLTAEKRDDYSGDDCGKELLLLGPGSRSSVHSGLAKTGSKR